jgi:hypothetical protein
MRSVQRDEVTHDISRKPIKSASDSLLRELGSLRDQRPRRFGAWIAAAWR